MKLEDLKVLICDDSILSRKKVRDALTAIGCVNIFDATDGELAVEAYKKYQPHLVLMDIIMPRKDGIEAVKDIMEYDPKAYIIMASSVGTQTYLKEALKAGACDFLQKPIDMEQLQRVIEKTVKGD